MFLRFFGNVPSFAAVPSSNMAVEADAVSRRHVSCGVRAPRRSPLR